MYGWADLNCTAFDGDALIATGALKEVIVAVKHVVDNNPKARVLIFDDVNAAMVEVDLRGAIDDVVARLPKSDPTAPIADPAPAGPGRPKLGVVAREVTLLPRHWEWLNEQPGGASVALRKLVEDARRANAPRDAARKARDVTYRFLSALAGDLPGYEEATRALFAGDRERFVTLMADWSADVRDHALRLAAGSFGVAE
ncbi:MAG TPA: DUF2239 family protein [Capsulimonadaceae bacterium]|jgi:hypothetical protein